MLYIHDGASFRHIDRRTKWHHLQRGDKNWRLSRETLRQTWKNKQLAFLSYTEAFLKAIKLPRWYISYFPTAMTKRQDQGNLWKKALNGGLQFQRLRIYDHRGGEYGNRQAGCWSLYLVHKYELVNDNLERCRLQKSQSMPLVTNLLQ